MGIVDMKNYLVIFSGNPLQTQLEVVNQCDTSLRFPLKRHDEIPAEVQEYVSGAIADCNFDAFYGFERTTDAGRWFKGLDGQEDRYILQAEDTLSDKVTVILMSQLAKLKNSHFEADSRGKNGELFVINTANPDKKAEFRPITLDITSATRKKPMPNTNNLHVSIVELVGGLVLCEEVGEKRTLPEVGSGSGKGVQKGQHADPARKFANSAGCKCKKTDRPVPSKDSAEPSVHPKPDQPVPPKGDDESDNDRLGFVFDSI